MTPALKAYLGNVEEQARKVVAAWAAWCDEQGWDNPAFDPFADALNELDELLEQKPKEDA